MALFKKVQNPAELVVGKKFIDEERHKILICSAVMSFGSMFEFTDIDDEDDRIILQWSEVKQKLRHFNLSNLELRTLLCASMIDFLLIMLAEDNNKI